VSVLETDKHGALSSQTQYTYFSRRG